MKPIISITALLAILALAIIGVLYIFEMISVDYATSTLIKVEAAIILLAGMLGSRCIVGQLKKIKSFSQSARST